MRKQEINKVFAFFFTEGLYHHSDGGVLFFFKEIISRAAISTNRKINLTRN